MSWEGRAAGSRASLTSLPQTHPGSDMLCHPQAQLSGSGAGACWIAAVLSLFILQGLWSMLTPDFSVSHS